MAGPGDLTVVTWNLFHGQDGARLGPTPRSAILRRGLDDGEHLHLNRKWIPEMAAVIAKRAPVFAALQEVPPRAVAQLSELTGMRLAHSVMPPRLGSTRLRGRLAERNPDLWQTHEGTANVVLIAPPWEIVPGGTWTVRHNPANFVIRSWGRLQLSRRERVHWLLEPRTLVAVRARHPSGATVTVVSLHCHNSLVWDLIATEVRRILPLVLERVPADEPMIIAGDFNSAGPTHPALTAVLDAGFVEPTLPDLVLDHIFARHLEVVAPPTTLPQDLRRLPVRWKGKQRTVLLSDHELVEAVFRLPD